MRYANFTSVVLRLLLTWSGWWISVGSRISVGQVAHIKASLNSNTEMHVEEASNTSGGNPVMREMLVTPGIALAKGGKAADVASDDDKRLKSPLGILHTTCEDHEAAEKAFPYMEERYQRAAVRGRFDGMAVAIGDIKVQGLDIPIDVSIQSTRSSISARLRTQRKTSRGCSESPGKAAAACVRLSLTDVDLRPDSFWVSLATPGRADKMEMLLHLDFDMTLTLGKHDTDKMLVQSLRLDKFDVKLEDMTIYGGIGLVNATLKSLIESRVVGSRLINHVAAFGEAVYTLLPIHEEMLRGRLLPNAEMAVDLYHRNCDESRLCLEFRTDATIKVKSALLNLRTTEKLLRSFVESTDLKLSESRQQKVASFIPPLTRGIHEVTGAVNVVVTPEPFQWRATTTWQAIVDIDDLLKLLGINVAKDDPQIRQFLKEHPTNEGWLRFAIQLGRDGPNPKTPVGGVGLFLAALHGPYVRLNAALGIDFVKMSDQKLAWKIQLHGQSNRRGQLVPDRAVPMSLSLGTLGMGEGRENFHCSYSDGAFWEICGMLGNNVEAEAKVSGSILLTETGDLVFCLVEPCAEGLAALAFSLHFRSPNIPDISISTDDIFIKMKTSRVLRALSRSLESALLVESERGPSAPVEEGDYADAVNAAKEDMTCSMFRSTYSRKLLNGTVAGWTGSPEKRREDEARIRELTDADKIQFFVREPDKGVVNAFNFANIGLKGDITVIARHPTREDKKWYQKMGLLGVSVLWILELSSTENVELVLQDFYTSDKSLNQKAAVLSVRRKIGKGDVSLLGLKAVMSMKMAVLGDGEIKGCFGSCCKHSVHIDKLSSKRFNIGIRGIKAVRAQVAAAGLDITLGKFGKPILTEVMGNFVPKLLEIPLKAAMAHLVRSGNESFVPLGGVSSGADSSSFSFRLQLGHDLMEGGDELRVQATPAMKMRILDRALQFPYISWIGGLQRDRNKLLRVSPGERFISKIGAALQLSLRRCERDAEQSADCSYSSAIPLSIHADPQNARVDIKLDSFTTYGNLKVIMALISHYLAQPFEKEDAADFCLSGLDHDPALRRHSSYFPPLTREPVFEEPLHSLKGKVELNADVRFSVTKTKGKVWSDVDKLGREHWRNEQGQFIPKPADDEAIGLHETEVSANGVLQFLDPKGLWQVFANDAGIADFGYVFFHGRGFSRVQSNFSLSSSTNIAVTVRCGSLIFDDEVEIDLTDPDVSLDGSDDPLQHHKDGQLCLTISRPKRGLEITDIVDKRKFYKICVQEEDFGHLGNLLKALQTELARQQAFRTKGASGSYSCKLPSAPFSVLAQPAKAGAFDWKYRKDYRKGADAGAEAKLTRPQLLKAKLTEAKLKKECLKACANHPACAGVSVRDECLFLGDEEARSRRSIFFKKWKIIQP